MTTRKYDNGSSGWTDYDDSGNAVGAGTYNAPGTARNPFNSGTGGEGVNSGEGSLWNNSTNKKVGQGILSPSVFDATSIFSQMQSDFAQQIADIQSTVDSTNYTSSNQSTLNKTVQDVSNNVIATPTAQATPQSNYNSGAGASIKSKAISRYLTDMWANK